MNLINHTNRMSKLIKQALFIFIVTMKMHTFKTIFQIFIMKIIYNKMNTKLKGLILKQIIQYFYARNLNEKAVPYN